MENKNAAFSEDISKAILDMLIRNSAQICVMQEQINLLMAVTAKTDFDSIQKGQIERYSYHAARLRETIFANYGSIDIQDLLGE